MSNGFTFPKGEDIFPFSSSSSSGGSQQSASSSSQSRSYSGLPTQYRDELLSAVMPSLSGGVQNMEQNIDDYTNQAYSRYQQQMQNMLRETMPQAISNLSQRGILDSSVASDTLSKLKAQIMNSIGDKMFQAGMTGSQMKVAMPQILGNIAQLGQSQDASNRSQSRSSGSSQQRSQSYQEDKTRMYDIFSDTLTALF